MIRKAGWAAGAAAPLLLALVAFAPWRPGVTTARHSHAETSSKPRVPEWRELYSCGECSRWSYLPTSPWEKHKFVSGDDTGDEGQPVEPMDDGPESAWYSAGLFDCQAFNSCHSNEQSGDCYQFHYTCGEHVAAALKLLDVAIQTRSRAQFQNLVTGFGKAVRIVPDRQVIQVLDCIGAVVAQQPLAATNQSLR